MRNCVLPVPEPTKRHTHDRLIINNIMLINLEHLTLVTAVDDPIQFKYPLDYHIKTHE